MFRAQAIEDVTDKTQCIPMNALC